MDFLRKSKIPAIHATLIVDSGIGRVVCSEDFHWVIAGVAVMLDQALNGDHGNAGLAADLGLAAQVRCVSG